MLTICISVLFYLVFLLLGIVLQFLDTNAYYTIPLFILFISLCSLWYHEANTKSIERKDFILASVFVALLYLFYTYFAFEISKVFFCYYYLAAFVCIILYADSIRFKSLI